MTWGNERHNTTMREEHSPHDGVEGFVYFLTAGDAIKIGYSKNPQQRCSDIQDHCPVPLRLIAYVPGTVAKERAIHEMFAHLRMHNEWFEFDREIQDYIDELTGKKPAPVPVVTGRPVATTPAIIHRRWRVRLASRDPLEGQAAKDAEYITRAINELKLNFGRVGEEVAARNLSNRLAEFDAAHG